VVVVEGPRGRVFRPAATTGIVLAMTLISRLAGPLVVVALVVLLATGNFYSPSPLVIACQLGGVAIAVWARSAFAAGQFRASPTPGGEAVIRRGPYRLIRHPMYAGALLLLWATALSHLSVLCLAAAAVPTLAVVPRVVDEERQLRARYPDYSEYARATRRLIPYLF
jgi:protein-S-isoprenylcysteine O-methyltransferase Ste14